MDSIKERVLEYLDGGVGDLGDFGEVLVFYKVGN